MFPLLAGSQTGSAPVVRCLIAELPTWLDLLDRDQASRLSGSFRGGDQDGGAAESHYCLQSGKALADVEVRRA
jgi:hypothetical protein